MGGGLSKMAKQQLVATIRDRYRESSKEDKRQVLDELTAEQPERLAAALRDIDAKKAPAGHEVVRYAPGDTPVCGEDVLGGMCTYEPAAVTG